MHLFGEAHAPPWLVGDAFWEPNVRVESAYLAPDILKIFTFHERTACGTAHGEALQIPRDVLAQVMHGHPLVAIIEFGQQFGMPFDHAAHVAQRGVDALVTAGERVLEILLCWM